MDCRRELVRVPRLLVSRLRVDRLDVPRVVARVFIINHFLGSNSME